MREKKSGRYKGRRTINSRATRIAHQRQNDVDSACVVIPDRLYFMTAQVQPKPDQERHFFCIDTVLRYEPFFMDFGPLNMGCLYHFCELLKGKLSEKRLENHKIYFYTACDAQRIANAAYLVGAYQIIEMGRKPDQAYACIQPIARHGAVFRDASMGLCTYKHNVQTTLVAIHKAIEWKFLDFDTFDVAQYEYYERVEYGDFNILIPGKFIAFAGPSATNIDAEGYPALTPEYYVKIWRKLGVTTIIRLNKKCYDKNRFTRHGFEHFDIYYTDGTVPSRAQLKKFLTICENAKGVVAVHCKAGLGRTGTCIGCYMMKHYRWTAADIIAWLRVCRPGSVLGPQQHYLEEQQPVMWKEGQLFRKNFMSQQSAQSPTSVNISSPVKSRLRGNPTTTSSEQRRFLSEKLGLRSKTVEQEPVNAQLSPPSSNPSSSPMRDAPTRSALPYRYSTSPSRAQRNDRAQRTTTMNDRVQRSDDGNLPRFSPRSPLTPPTTTTPTTRSISQGRRGVRTPNTRAYSRYTSNLSRADPVQSSSQLNRFSPTQTRSRTQPPSQAPKLTSLGRRSWVKSAISDLNEPAEENSTQVKAGLKSSSFARAGLGAATTSSAPLPTDPGQNQARALLNAKKVSQARTREREHDSGMQTHSDMPLPSNNSPHPSMLPTPSNKLHLQHNTPRPASSPIRARGSLKAHTRTSEHPPRTDAALRPSGSRWSGNSGKLKRVNAPDRLSTSTNPQRTRPTRSGLGRNPPRGVSPLTRLSGYKKRTPIGLKSTSKIPPSTRAPKHNRSRSSPAVRSANRRVPGLGASKTNYRTPSSGRSSQTRSTLTSLRSRLSRRSNYGSGDHGLS